MNRKLGARVERLETRVGAAPDVAAEAGRYGRRLWSVPGFRAYGADSAGGARLAVAGPAGSLVYEVVGVPLGDLS
jgi:hypothetical protein